jgi:hypothetical protein
MLGEAIMIATSDPTRLETGRRERIGACCKNTPLAARRRKIAGDAMGLLVRNEI